MRHIFGLLAILLATGLSCFWAFWGGIENLHEGWTNHNIIWNIIGAFIRYIPWMILAISLSVVALYYKFLGGLIYIVLGGYFILRCTAICMNQIQKFPVEYFVILSILPFIGFCFLFGKLPNKRFSYVVLIGLPLATFAFVSSHPMERVIHRMALEKQADSEIYVQEINGKRLIWSPRITTAGILKKGCSWSVANRICAHLSKNGRNIESVEQNFWRLPTKEEVVACLTRNGKNCNGRIGKTGKALYDVMPDKEYPIWDPYNTIIELWTSSKDEKNKNLVYSVFYYGEVYTRSIDEWDETVGFRAVRYED
ncbi:MAG TPA: hypothetical protein P5543_04795 [Planctomycetota bacterium]|nr:hypothetical protein [Planctomycetota bacterium]